MKLKHIAVIIAVLASVPVSIAGFLHNPSTPPSPLAQHVKSASSVAAAVDAATDVSAKTQIGALALGDGKTSSSPKKGYAFTCQQSFNANQGGAGTDGPWIQGALWYPDQKVSVGGKVQWKNAKVAIASKSGSLSVTGNGLPTSGTTGTFPISASDPAYQYDRNPNGVKTQNISLSLPGSPTIAKTPTCVGMGMIGVATNGVAIFNGLDAGGRDAVAHEVQDSCGGHPQQEGMYHYHGPSTCMPNAQKKNALVGYALDGFGIFSMYDRDGAELTNADLDECHGRTSKITWNGKTVNMYHYVLTREYPYTIGCFRGTPVKTKQGAGGPGQTQTGAPTTPGQNGSSQQMQNGQQPGGNLQRPPEEALRACSGKSAGAVCGFTSARGDAISGTCGSPTGEALACMPAGGPPRM